MHRWESLVCIMAAFGFLVPSGLRAATPTPADFQPDPQSVQRYGPAYRYPHAGWIVLHIEGEPYERGYQHGRLLAPEITAFLRCFATMQSPKAPTEGWKNTRSLVNALFVRRYEKEYLEEMRGIADGASAAGARFDNRPIDLVDVVGLNVWPEVDTLDSALEALPTGLEGTRFPHSQPRTMPAPKPMRCSAFAATGPATADGKIVFGHITMFGLYPSTLYNVWLDVKPAKGHRVLMQSYPAGIQSGMDYYMNDAGLLVAETTIAQTLFDIRGMSVASRIRHALQYADSIDQAVDILKAGNNGLYTNEWLLADIKTNEIAMFELGTAKSKLYRSSKHEWFGGTEGFYWGCNNTKDRQVRLETIPGVQGKPANMVFCPSDRDKTWLRLFHEYRGKIDVQFGKLAFTTPPLAAYHSVDAKFTTTDLAKDLKTWALFGPPLGRTWQPSSEELKRFPEIRPLVSNPWTILGPVQPDKALGPVAVDLTERLDSPAQSAAHQEEDRPLATVPAWHGTLLPKTDADIWLATAFAQYERIVADEHALQARHEADGETNAGLTSHDRERLAAQLFAHRSNYLAGARTGEEKPLAKTHPALTQSDWYAVASGKGVLVLHELRRILGAPAFEEAMDSFGRDNAGKEVTSAQFQAHLEKTTRKSLAPFFEYWLHQSGLPVIRLGKVTATKNGDGYQIEGELLRDSPVSPDCIQLTLVTSKGEESWMLALESSKTQFTFTTAGRPQRLLVDRYGNTAKQAGGVFSVLSFYADLEHSLIVYGTGNEVAANREAAEALQRGIIERHSNFTVPIKTDRDVTAADLQSHHLLLIGRPDTNALVERFRKALPVGFGHGSFTVGHETYAHAGSAVIAAGVNPRNSRYSLVVFAGLSADSTYHAPAALLKGNQAAAEVLVLPNHEKPRSLVVPAAELVKEFEEPTMPATQKAASSSLEK
ncbi:MAG TPA: C45 family autoproteolytic acyltransferase/hydrolase [Gemmataceae bacterium]|nr:C45 family autoproteolytic acyltransferase/hydrolase [Gemmataceae bacterium]